MAATGGASGNAVTFTSSGVCTNSGTTYTMTSGTGTCSVIANQAGNASYAAATQVSQTVNATLASQTIKFTQKAPAQATYNSSFTVVATATSGLTISYSSSGPCSDVTNPDGSATYTMGNIAWNCKVTASQSGNGNYLAATSVTEITAATSSIAPTVTFTGAPQRILAGGEEWSREPSFVRLMKMQRKSATGGIGSLNPVTKLYP